MYIQAPGGGAVTASGTGAGKHYRARAKWEVIGVFERRNHDGRHLAKTEAALADDCRWSQQVREAHLALQQCELEHHIRIPESQNCRTAATVFIPDGRSLAIRTAPAAPLQRPHSPFQPRDYTPSKLLLSAKAGLRQPSLRRHIIIRTRNSQKRCSKIDAECSIRVLVHIRRRLQHR